MFIVLLRNPLHESGQLDFSPLKIIININTTTNIIIISIILIWNLFMFLIFERDDQTKIYFTVI